MEQEIYAACNTPPRESILLSLCFCSPAMPDYLLSFQYLHPHHCQGGQHNHGEPFPVLQAHLSPEMWKLQCTKADKTSALSHCPGVGINRFSYIKMVFQTSGDMNEMHFQRRNFSMLLPTQDWSNKERSREWLPFQSFLFSKVWKACWKVLCKLQTGQTVSKIPVVH